MAPRNERGERVHGDVLGAGAAGGGLGTVVAAMANSMPTGKASSLLIVTAPILSVGVSGLWLFIKTVYINPYAAKKSNEAKRANFDWLITQARETYDAVLADPNATAQHKAAVRKKLEKLQLLSIDDLAEKVDILFK